MDLFKTFTRGQENAQDQLNANFAALEGAVIVESGSNANGSWTKFADGMMICNTMIKMAGSCTISRGVFFVAPVEQWLYPAWFVGAPPSVTGSVVGGIYQAFYTSGNNEINVAQCTFSVGYYENSSPNTALVSLIAIGRWK